MPNQPPQSRESTRVGPLWQRLRTQPRLSDLDGVRWRLADLDAGVMDIDLRACFARPRVRGLLAGLADHSPYLWQLVANDPKRLYRILNGDPQAYLDATLGGLFSEVEDEADLMRRLRLAKQEVALLVALADIGGVWHLEDVVAALSRAADAFILAALRHLLRAAGAAGRLKLADDDCPETGCGIAILGLGKLGGCELNYSSDVDLVVVFDPENPSVLRPDTYKALFVRMVQDLVRLLQQPTRDGYVLRVDLRLRPDPGATAVAISINSAFLYYESVGQNWERAALIKARPVAGDLALGQRFIDGLAPFIWRRYFDYAAIADIHAMKRQIHVVKGHGEIAVAGHNVKLGRGGIREIEFFVQTQQLIFGGKRPELRGRRTLEMLRELRREGWIGPHAVADLRRAYDFLRWLEHRLQMIADEQTHRLPIAPEALERFARFCGFASAARLSAVLNRHLRAVAHHYALLFENAPDLADAGGSLVFTGTDDDPETLETLTGLGYKAPSSVTRVIRDWHAGRRSSVRTPRARETLTELVPKLLVTFSRAADPDGAVAAFDKALERMPAAGELFVILNANPSLRMLFADILGSAPRLAAEVMLRPHLLDGAIDPVRSICLDEDLMESRAVAVLSGVRSTEDFLDAIRDFHHEEHFLIGAALLSGDLDPGDAGRAYAALAVAIIRVAFRRLCETFAVDHGVLPGAAAVVLAMGKLGSREMTAVSDLDIVLIYTFDPDQATSDGARQLPASQYFTRLTQRLVAYLTAASRRGRLYEVDMRLRPSGRQGPIATQLSAFVGYQREEAATWEHMALTRARPVAGDAALGAVVASDVEAILSRAPKVRLAADVREMRALIEKEKPAKGRWDLKLAPGGLVDIEFVAQYLVLRHAQAEPSLFDTSTQSILQRAGDLGLIVKERAERLIAAHRLLTTATQIMRLALDDDHAPDAAGEAVKRRMAEAAGVPDFGRLVEEIVETLYAVREIFRAVLSDA